MTFKAAVPAVVFMAILMAGITAAQEISPIEVTIAPVNATTYRGSTMNYVFTIHNNQGVTDGLTISVNGIHLEWMNLESNYVEVMPHSSKDLYFALYPMNDNGTFAYKITAESHTNSDMKASANAYLTVMEPPKVENVVVDRLFIKKHGNVLDVDMGLYSNGAEPAAVTLNIEDVWGAKVNSFIYSMATAGGRNITETVELPAGLKAGKYRVLAEVEGSDIKAQANFYVEAVDNMSTIERVVSSPLFSDVAITLVNNGNTDETGYEVSRDFPRGLMVTWNTPYTRCYDNKNVDTCVWSVDVPAGQEETISYRIEYWPAIAEIVVIILAIFSIVLLLFIKVSRPTIVKSYRKIGGGRYTIMVEVKNPFFKKLTNVVLKDSISSIATVEPLFETVKPVVRKSESRTELAWKLSDFGAREERLIHYNISSAVHGSMTMPKASISFTTESGRKYVLESKPLVIE